MCACVFIMFICVCVAAAVAVSSDVWNNGVTGTNFVVALCDRYGHKREPPHSAHMHTLTHVNIH